MKKLLRNKKGFSLVELVIVIAILGVLAAIAISMFTGIIGRSRTRADEVMARKIETAITTYISETGNSDITATAHGGSTATLLVWLQNQHPAMTINNVTSDWGPYLENVNAPQAPIANSYYPQANGMNGWDITVTAATGEVVVDPVAAAGGTVTVN